MWWPPGDVSDADRAARAAALRSAAGGVLVVPDWPAELAAHPDWLARDDIHLTEDGYRGLAAFLRDELDLDWARRPCHRPPRRSRRPTLVTPTPEPGPCSDRHLAFVLALLDVVPAGATQNVVISPWSVSSALGVLAPGCGARPEPRCWPPSSRARALADDLLVADLAVDAAAVVAERS